MNTVIHVSSIYLRLIHLITPPTSSAQFLFNKKYTYNNTSPQRSPLNQRPLGMVPENGRY